MKYLHKLFTLPASVCLLLIIFLIDISIVHDLPILFLYMLPLFLASLKNDEKYLKRITIYTCSLLVFGALFSHNESLVYGVVFSRAIEICILWISYLILCQKIKAEDKLTRGNRLLESILDNTHLYLAYMDKDFNFIRVNRAYAMSDGKDPSYFTGKNHFTLYPNEENEQIFRRVVATGEPYYIEEKPFVYENNPERGTTYWNWSLIPVKNNQGAIEGLLMSLANVTEQVRTKKEVGHYYKLLDALYSSVNEAIFFINPATMKVEDCNHAAEKIFGYTKYEMIGLAAKQRHISEESFRKFDDMVMSSYAEKGYFDTEYQMKRKDGTIFPCENFVTPIYDESGKLIVHVSIVRDITERKKIENELKHQGTLLKTIFDNLPVGVWVTDKAGNIILGNPAAQGIWGGAKYVGIENYHEYRAWWADTGEMLRAEDWAIVRAISNGEISLNEKIKIQCFDGAYKTILNSAVPIKDENSSIIGAVIVNQDITQEMQNQQKLKKTLEDLENTNKELEQFAYVASHDLQEPLRMVSAYTTLLGRKQGPMLDENTKVYMDFIVEGAKRMQVLIKDLLDYSRISKKEHKFDYVNCKSLINAAVSNLDIQIKESGTRIFYDSYPLIKASPLLLTQLFQNLISNAIKFRGEAAPEIYIGCEKRKKEYMFFVRDNGIGISHDYFDKIFEIFQRLHERDDYPGTGIGLTICKKIVERHGGRIWVESDECKGTTFYFTIPR